VVCSNPLVAEQRGAGARSAAGYGTAAERDSRAGGAGPVTPGHHMALAVQAVINRWKMATCSMRGPGKLYTYQRNHTSIAEGPTLNGLYIPLKTVPCHRPCLLSVATLEFAFWSTKTLGSATIGYRPPLGA
jgi:hypothetical protein